MGFADRVEAGIRSGVVNASSRSNTREAPKPCTHKIAETDPRHVRGYLKVTTDTSSGTVTVTAKASDALIGTITRDGADHVGAHHAGAITRSRKVGEVLSGLAAAQNTYADALRAAE